MAEAAAAVGLALVPVAAMGVGKAGLWLKRKIFSSNKDMKESRQDLEEKMKRLGDKRDDYKSKENLSTKMLSETYFIWHNSVGDIEKEVEDLITESKKAYHFKSGHLSKRMKRMANKVMELLEQGNDPFQKFLVDGPLEPVVEMKAPNIDGIETHQEVLNKILNCLKNNKFKRIGIHGTLGIGKTAIMLNLNNHEEVAKMFELVIWLKVSTEESDENLNREHLQQAIMRRLKLHIENTSNADEDAKKIMKELEDKKYLLLLDDVREEFDLSQVGIPVPDAKNGSKIVLTSRLPHICRDMGVDQNIKMTCLSDTEAWKMFQDVLQCPEINQDKLTLAFELYRGCGGHPLYIETVAKTFRAKNKESLWANGLGSCIDWPVKGCEGLREFYKLLEKFCYLELDNGMKKCFLYGALYPEDCDINIDYLLECWAAEDFLKKEDPYVYGHAILDDLKNVSFEEGKSGEYVTMHKCFRQVALNILSNDLECKYLVKTNERLREPPDVESWKQKNWISIVHNELEKLPDCPNYSKFSTSLLKKLPTDCPNCSMLSTLFLQKNLGLKEIDESFFDHKKSLRVLDLSHTGITLLPPSLSKLIKLKVLNLSECKNLKKLASQIVKVEQLEALDIRGSGINGIPPFIENMSCLRRLRVSFTESGNENDTQEFAFNHGIISKLSSLEALVVDVKSLQQWSNKVAEEIIEEVATLKKFTSLKFFFPNEVVDLIEVVPTPPTLRIYVHESGILQTFIKKSHSWRKVQHINSFQFFIGCKNSKDPQIPKLHEYKRYVKYCDGEGCNLSILEVPVKADAFELVDHKDIKQLSDFPAASMNQVRGCLVKNCNTIETIVGIVDSVVLQNLEHLYVMNVPKLESICKFPMEPGSLSKLETLVLSSCPMLIKIFSHGVIQQLIEIQHLKFEDCSEVEEIISEAEIVTNPQVLPKLKKLTLLNMPKLECIYANESLEWPSLEELEISKCSSLLKLPFNMDNTKKLKSIEAEKDWWEALQWQNKNVKQLLQKIFK